MRRIFDLTFKAKSSNFIYRKFLSISEFVTNNTNPSLFGTSLFQFQVILNLTESSKTFRHDSFLSDVFCIDLNFNKIYVLSHCGSLHGNFIFKLRMDSQLITAYVLRIVTKENQGYWCYIKGNGD